MIKWLFQRRQQDKHNLMSKYKYLTQPIGHNHAGPPEKWVDELARFLAFEPAGTFAPNANHDVYTLLRPALLAPGTTWQGDLQRRAAIGVAMLCISGDESDWNWNEGRDVTAGPQTEAEKEAGPFQVSYDSRGLDKSLAEYLLSIGIADAGEFQRRMKQDHKASLAYVCRLLRVSTRWDGPCNRDWIAIQVKPEAVTELARWILSVNPSLTD